MALSGRISSTIGLSLTSAPDIGAASWSSGSGAGVAHTLTDGSAANKASKVFEDHSAATLTYDLDGGALTTPLGATQAAFSRIVSVRISCPSTNSAPVKLSGDFILTKYLIPGADSLSEVTIPIHPGGQFLFVAPDATGVAVTASTGDGLTVTVAGSDAYDIIIVGS